MTARSLSFTGPGHVEVREKPIPEPAADEVRVRTEVSAISPGTELHIYRGETPTEMAVDETIDALPGTFEFPLTYGYGAAGQVTAVGTDVSDEWIDTAVFAFHPHESHFTVSPDELVLLPENCSMEVAAFLANVESAVNFLMDGRPVVGERVAVFGQGVVGLLTTALLSQYPLESLVTVDLYERRRELSERLGADEALNPDATDIVERLRDNHEPGGTDLAYELTRNPDALNQAIDAMAYDSRLVIGSWYGSNRASLDLGGRFHWNRGRLVSSQVSTISPQFSGRWSKDRRLDVAWDRLDGLEPTELITHRVPIERAPEAYRMLDERPQEAVQVLLTYD
jgi:threonine dehydrogenase-like Zn-dependent dehydrogenase